MNNSNENKTIRIKGTKDIFDLKIRNEVINSLKEFFTYKSFLEIKVPILESSNLFKRSLGNSSEVILKEMYFVQNVHEKENFEICLRPESTTSTMRAFIENGIQKNPWKIFTFGEMFRHEKPQMGRYREFTQFSVEIINADSLFYEIELISDLNLFFEQIGLKNFCLEINFLGSKEDRKNYEENLKEFIKKNFDEKLFKKIEAVYNKNPLRILDLKDEEIQKKIINIPKIEDFYCENSKLEFEKIKKI